MKWSNFDKHIPVWIILLTIGIIFLGIGFANNQLTEFFRKATMICLECIGIG